MVDAGCNARQMIELIGPDRRQSLRWRPTSPTTSAVCSFLSFCPIAPLSLQCLWRCGASFVSLVLASGRSRIRSANFFDASPWQTQKGPVQRVFQKFILKVTTPASLGASSVMGRGEEYPLLSKDGGGERESPSFKEVVACGAGVVPFAFHGEVSAVNCRPILSWGR